MFDYFYGQSGEMFSYFRVPKILFRDIKFKDLSTDAKTLYGILLDRMGLSVKNGWLDEQGRVYIIFPVQEVMDALGCADNKATKLFRELEKFGLIERKRRGLGKPNLIYVKNFADPRCRNRGKNGSGAADSAQQETAKSRGNKTEWNKTEGSEPDPFSSDAEDEPDERTRLEAYFMQSLEVDLLLRVCPDEEDTIDQIVNVNVKYLFQMSVICYPYLKKSADKGRIINITSMSAHLGFSEVVPYCASKGAVLAMTRALAVEWAQDNITVNSIAPGCFRSKMNEQVVDAAREQKILNRMPLHAYGDTRDLGKMTEFLVGDGAAYITGQDFAVDGGALAFGY